MVLKGPIDISEENDARYTSSHINQFAWADDPQGTAGLLFVEFKGSGRYVYYDVPKRVFERMEEYSLVEQTKMTTGEYFQQHVRNKYDRDQDYDEFSDVL